MANAKARSTLSAVELFGFYWFVLQESIFLVDNSLMMIFLAGVIDEKIGKIFFFH